MPDTPRDIILNAIQARMEGLSSNDTTIYDLDELREEVQKWDGISPPRFLDQLKALGMSTDLLDLDFDAPKLTAEDINAIETGLRRALDKAADDDKRRLIRAAGREFSHWHKSGQAESLPCAEQLAEWGIWPQVMSVPEASNTGAVIAQSPATADGEQAWLDEMAQAVKLYEQRQYFQALDRFRNLSPRARGDWVDRLDRYRDEAERGLDAQEGEKIADAENTVKRSPNNLDRQEEAWKAVQALKPTSRRAQDELFAIEQRRARAPLEADLTRWQAELKLAVDGKLLPTIDALWGQAKARQAKLSEGDSDILGEELHSRLTKWTKDVEKARRELRDELGIGPTLALEADLLPAYVWAKRYTERGTPVIPVDAAARAMLPENTLIHTDETGNEYLNTNDFFRAIATRLIAGLRINVGEKIESAKAAQNEDPSVARGILNKALELLDPEVPLTQEEREAGKTRSGVRALSKEHAQELDGSRKTVERALQELEKTENRYKEAHDLFTEAIRTGDPAERLNLLAAAADKFSNYPGLRESEQTARDQYASRRATELEASISDARILTAAERFEEAKTHLAAKKAEALLPPTTSRLMRDVPWPPPGSGLVEQLAAISTAQQEVVHSEMAYDAMLATVRKAEEQLNTGADDALIQASSLLDTLPPATRAHKLVVETQARLAAKRSFRDNWEEGRTKFSLGEWDLAEPPLKSVAASTSPEKAESERLLKLIQAVRHVQAARTAGTQADWGVALRQYQAADLLFKTYRRAEDASVADLAKACETGLIDLGPLAENNAVVAGVLERAEATLHQLEQVAQSRANRDLLDRLQPLAGIADLVKELEDCAGRKSSYGQKLEKLLGDARTLWRSTNVAAMQAARGAQDAGILEAAIKRSEELRQAKLLYRDDDKALDRELRLQAVDQEYEALLAKAERNWADIAANRRRKLDILSATEKQQRSMALKELQDAQCEELLAQAAQLESSGQPADAQKYLEKELKASYNARTDSRLIGALVEVCWRAGDWTAARRAAHNFAGLPDAQGPALEKAWLGLTVAADAFARNEHDIGQAKIEDLRRGAAPEVLKVVNQEARLLLDAMRERLLNEAQQAEARGEFLLAAEKLSLVNTLEPNSNLVHTHLTLLGGKVSSSLRGLADRATTYQLGSQRLEKAIEESGRLLKSLADLQKVADLLKLDDALREELNAAFDKLTTTSKPWLLLKNDMDEFDRKLLVALKSPVLLDEAGQGGWLLDNAGQHLTSAESRVKWEAPDAKAHVGRRRTQFDEALKRAEEVRALVAQLMASIRTEDFPAAITSAEALEKAWPKAAQAGMDGLGTLIAHNYGSDIEPICRPNEHRQKAIEQLENYNQWHQWSKRTVDAYDAILTAESALLPTGLTDAISVESQEEMLQQRLDDLVYEKSLTEILKQCKAVLIQCKLVQDAQAQMPRSGPISEAAERAQREVLIEPFRTKARQSRAALEQLVKVIEKRQSSFGDDFRRLKVLKDGLEQAMKPRRWGKEKQKAPPLKQVEQLRRALDRCNALDPLHDDLQHYRDYLDTLPGSAQTPGSIQHVLRRSE